MNLPRVQSGEPLTAQLWNDLARQIESSQTLTSDGSLGIARGEGGAAIGAAPSTGARIIEIRGGTNYGDPVSPNDFMLFQGRVNVVDQNKDDQFFYTADYDPFFTSTPYIPGEDVGVVTMGSYYSAENRHSFGALAPPPLLIHGDRFLGFRVGNTDLVPTSPSPPRPLYVIRPPESIGLFYNNSGSTVPSWGLMKVTGWRLVGSAWIAEIAMPDDSFSRVYLVNSERAVAAGRYGRYQQGAVVTGKAYLANVNGIGVSCGARGTHVGWDFVEQGLGFRFVSEAPHPSLLCSTYHAAPPDVLKCSATANILAGATNVTTYTINDSAGFTMYGPGAGKVPPLDNITNTKIASGDDFYAWTGTADRLLVLAPTQKYVTP